MYVHMYVLVMAPPSTGARAGAKAVNQTLVVQQTRKAHALDLRILALVSWLLALCSLLLALGSWLLVLGSWLLPLGSRGSLLSWLLEDIISSLRSNKFKFEYSQIKYALIW